MNNASLTAHEMMELHELMSMEIMGTKRTKASLNMVQDEQLKKFMQDSLNSKNGALEQIQSFLSTQANIIIPNNQQNQNNQQQNQQSQQNQSKQQQNQQQGNQKQGQQEQPQNQMNQQNQQNQQQNQKS
jgi:hypothetical protein